MKTIRHIIAILLLIPQMASAQFFVTGDDPGKLKWSTIESENFKIIYPEGNDSLAYLYGRNLERFRIPVSRSMRTSLADRTIRSTARWRLFCILITATTAL